MVVSKWENSPDPGSCIAPRSFDSVSSCFSLRADKVGGHSGGHHRLRQRVGGLPRGRCRYPHSQLGGRLAQNPRDTHLLCQRHRWDFWMIQMITRKRDGEEMWISDSVLWMFCHGKLRNRGNPRLLLLWRIFKDLSLPVVKKMVAIIKLCWILRQYQPLLVMSSISGEISFWYSNLD